ncbi:hypothetical protein N7509_008199 [Penicillium cosmopolitanum]|uniref:Uncharacterized protein n=1 Tax=Penicillium cosmopolitanum TaxID=1131564 RepID=A0A9W9VM52_9EURO|nr:uncharacterized protein N7509_008199 [Penicillium cosmopolitanum]KAJ5385658.1 hypothetical protein N7509_008199 [Penicillium cosmopolitanum]
MRPKPWVFKYAIPRSYRNIIAYLVELIMTNVEFYELTGLPLSRLTATEVSLVAHLLGIWDAFLNRDKYLSPLRDVDPTMQFFDPLIQDRHRILIFGHGVLNLTERIQCPAGYWSRQLEEISRGNDPPVPRIWIVCIPPDAHSHAPALASMSYREAHKIFQAKVMIQPKGRDLKKVRPPGIDTVEVWLSGMGVYRMVLEPSFDDWGEKMMCSIGGICFPIDWDDIYENANSSSFLPYIEPTQDPHTVKHSDVCRTMKRKTDTFAKNGKVVQWKKKTIVCPRATISMGVFF